MKKSEQIYLARIWRAVAKYFPPGGHVLDAGCGAGTNSELLLHQGFRVTGIDIEHGGPAWARLTAAGAKVLQASAEALPFADASFDAVWVKDALHHMGRPEQALAELQRVVKPGGPVVVIEANRYNPVFLVHMTWMEGHQHFTRRQLRRMLRAADPGFAYHMVESRCLPWEAGWLLGLLQLAEDFLEKARVLDPWLTYQIGVVRGGSRRAGALHG